MAWVDLMGTGAMTEYSTLIGSTNIGKFHTAIKRSETIPNEDVYAYMDGAYILANDMERMLSYLREIYQNAAKALVERHRFEDFDPQYTYIIRGVVAEGEVYEGKNIDPDSDTELGGSEYAENLIMGNPIVQAGGREGHAPPFGVLLDTEPDSSPTEWEWWTEDYRSTANILKRVIRKYFDWADENIDGFAPFADSEDAPSYWSQVDEYLPESKFDLGSDAHEFMD